MVTLLMAVIPQAIRDESVSYHLMLLLMFVQGCAIAFLQSALYGLAGVSQALNNNLMVGIGIGSVLMNGIRMIFMASFADHSFSTIIFFSLSSGYMLFCSILALTFIKGFSKTI